MSCQGKYKACAVAAGRNGIAGYINQSLGAIGSWGTVNAAIENAGGIGLDLKNPAGLRAEFSNVPWKMGNVAVQMAANAALDTVGLNLSPNGVLSMKNAKGLLLAAHAVEKAGGAATTLLARQLVRGKPYMKYQGVLVRKTPLTGKLAGAKARLSRGRATADPEGEDYHFYQDGITWANTTTRFNILRDTPKTLSVLRSLSFPNRSYYFDRRLDEQNGVDLVLGNKDPETIPGYLGSTNQLDSVCSPLRRAKKALMGLNWLTVDDTERDIRTGEVVDYDRFFGGSRGKQGTVQYDELSRTRLTNYTDLLKRAASGRSTKKEDEILIKHTITYKDMVSELGGRDFAPKEIDMPELGVCKLRIDAVDELEDGRTMAEAYYFHPKDRSWEPIVDERVQANLGKQLIDEWIGESKKDFK